MGNIPEQQTLKNRIHNRMPCHSTGEIVLGDGSHEIHLLDVSSGGCKVKLPDAPDGGILAGDLPVEFVLTSGSLSVPGAFIWFMSGMFGCHFFEHILLDSIAQIMSGGFRVRLLPKAPADV